MPYNDTTLVIPTLNEKETLPILIKKVLGSYDGINILVVDDGSKDGTLESMKKFTSNRRVNVLDRKKLGKKPGLTASILDGIMKSSTRYVIVMDADLQHPAKKISKIHDDLAKGYKLVVAVREQVMDWPLYRKIISRSLSGIGYVILFANGKKVTADIFSGFFGIDRKTAASIISREKVRFVGEGYKFLFDLLKSIDTKDEIAISEVKYSFGNRKFGESKAGAKQVMALFKSYVT